MSDPIDPEIERGLPRSPEEVGKFLGYAKVGIAVVARSLNTNHLPEESITAIQKALPDLESLVSELHQALATAKLRRVQ